MYKLGATTVAAGATALVLVLAVATQEPGLLLGGIVASLVAIYIFLYCGRMRTVVLAGRTLHISTLRSTVAVPLERLIDIETRTLFYPPIAYLHFDSATPAGRIVQFMPAGMRLLRDNPQLQAVVRLAASLRSHQNDAQQRRRGA